MTPKELILLLKNTPKELMNRELKVCVNYKDAIPEYKKIYSVSTFRNDYFGFEPAWDDDNLTIRIEGLIGND